MDNKLELGERGGVEGEPKSAVQGTVACGQVPAYAACMEYLFDRDVACCTLVDRDVAVFMGC